MKKLNPDNYNVEDYKIDEIVLFIENDNYYKAMITDIDYNDGSISIEFIKEE